MRKQRSRFLHATIFGRWKWALSLPQIYIMSFPSLVFTVLLHIYQQLSLFRYPTLLSAVDAWVYVHIYITLSSSLNKKIHKAEFNKVDRVAIYPEIAPPADALQLILFLVVQEFRCRNSQQFYCAVEVSATLDKEGNRKARGMSRLPVII